jgi:predicted MFS family arabinose efflux permease
LCPFQTKPNCRRDLSSIRESKLDIRALNTSVGKTVESTLGRSEIRQAWLVLLGCVLANALSVQVLPVYTASVFVSPLQRDFGWSRTEISIATTLIAFGTAAASPIVGLLLRRFPPVALIIVSLGAIGACFFGFSLMTGAIRNFWLIALVLAVLGAGASPVAVSRILIANFDKQRGLALGLSMFGIGVVAACAPPLTAELIARLGWRAGYASLAAVSIAAIPVVALLLTRRGRSKSRRAGDSKGAALEVANPRARLAYLCLGFFMVAVSIGGVVVHFVPMLIDGHFDPLVAGHLAGLVGISVLVGRIVTGVALDRIKFPGLAAGIMAMSAAGFILVGLASGRASVLAAPLVGLSLGAELDLVAFAAGAYFSAAWLELSLGVLYAIFLCGLGLSPIIYAQIYERGGAYSPAFLLAGFLLFLGSAVFAGLPRLTKKAEA